MKNEKNILYTTDELYIKYKISASEPRTSMDNEHDDDEVIKFYREKKFLTRHKNFIGTAAKYNKLNLVKHFIRTSSNEENEEALYISSTYGNMDVFIYLFNMCLLNSNVLNDIIVSSRDNNKFEIIFYLKKLYKECLNLNLPPELIDIIVDYVI